MRVSATYTITNSDDDHYVDNECARSIPELFHTVVEANRDWWSQLIGRHVRQLEYLMYTWSEGIDLRAVRGFVDDLELEKKSKI